MKKFMFLYKGYIQPTSEIGKAWMDWFQSVGDKMIDSGNPFSNGVEVSKSGVVEIPMDTEVFTGYSILNAESKEEAIQLAQSNPMITSVVIYELAKM